MKSDNADCANEPWSWEFESFLFVPWLDAQTHVRIKLHTLDDPWTSWCKQSEEKNPISF